MLHPSAFSERRRARARGFTLTELMIAIAIIGIMTALASVSFVRQVNMAKANEATGMIRAIAAAEERYRGETMQYLGPSSDLNDLYPMTSPRGVKYNWVQPTHPDWDPPAGGWKLLNVSAPGPVQFGYAVVAGAPGTALPTPSDTGTTFPWPAATSIKEPWYVIQATRDHSESFDTTRRKARFVASSFRTEIYSEGEDE
jgi:prepilin-type N-terminal cleavage/methylation domain-containing protein